MPSIHIIYDPQDRLQVPSSDVIKGCSVAMLRLTEIDPSEIDDIVEELTRLLGLQIKADQDGH